MKHRAAPLVGILIVFTSVVLQGSARCDTKATPQTEPLKATQQLLQGTMATPSKKMPSPSANWKPPLDARETTYLLEDFEGVFPPPGWSRYITNATHTWNRGQNYVYSGNFGAFVPWNFGQDEHLVSPLCDFSVTDSNLRVEFWWITSYYWMVVLDAGDYELWLSTDGGSTWPVLLWSEDNVGQFSDWTWYQASVSLAPYVGQNNIRLRWRYVAYDAADVGLDLVVITDDPITTRPPNDDCASVTPVPLIAGNPLTFTGNNRFATNDCQALGWPQVWHAFTTNICMNVEIDYCGTPTPFSQVYMLLVSGCPCDSIFDIYYGDITTCGDSNFTLRWLALPAGTYYLPVLYDPVAVAGAYMIHVRGEACPPPPANDNCADVTPSLLSPDTFLTFTGTNIGATNDCGLLPLPQVWHAFTIPSRLDVTIEYCGTIPSFGNAYPILTTGCPCDDLWAAVAFDDTTCGDGNWAITWWNLAAGTYYYPVLLDPLNYAQGPYVIRISATERLCEYVIGDINDDQQVRGSDITYGVRFFKGLGPPSPDSCYSDSLPSRWLYVAGDVNGNCEFRGSDITRLVAYFKAGTELGFCRFFPPPVMDNCIKKATVLPAK